MTYAIKTGEKAVTTSFVYECFEIGNYLAYKATAKSSNSRKEDVRQDIAAKSADRTLRQGKFPPSESGAYYRLYTDEQIAGIQRYGWNFLADYSNKKVNNAPRPEIYDYLVGGGNPANVLRSDGWNQFYTLEDEIVPTAIWFDYIEAHVDNAHYDLEKLVDILRSRDDVRFAEPRDHWPEKEGYPEIRRIPSYNAERGRTAYVSFCWLPTLEIMKVLIADMSNRHRTIFEQDLLGLRAGGAARYEEFYKSRVDDEEFYKSYED